MRAVDPVTIKLLDGTKWELLPTWGALRRATNRLGVSVIRALSESPELAVPALVYECMPQEARTRYDYEAFTDLLAADAETMQAVQQLAEMISGGSDRPTRPPHQAVTPDQETT